MPKGGLSIRALLFALCVVALAVPSVAEASPDGLVLPVPYRSQLDGSPYGPANCGPTAIGMALGAFGIRISSWDLRVQAMKAQGTWGDDYRHEWGVFIYNLAEVVRQHGLETSGLYDREGIKADRLHRWTLEDIRSQLERRRLVIAQLKFRAMPGRSRVPFLGDHYVVLHGYSGSDFIYSDPLDRYGGGSERRISGSALLQAMEASESPFSAFAIWQARDW